jgi:hypothetical protein
MVTNDRRGTSRSLATVCRTLVLTAGVIGATFPGPSAQVMMYPTGQTVAPAYEGWEQNPDGSFNLVFGYLNRNWEETVDVPIGPDNQIEPGDPDQNQPTHFLPRRNRFVFRIRVPKDFGDKELVWTLTTRGKTERAYGTLKPDYFIDDIVLMNNSGAGAAAGGGYNIFANKAPVLTVDGEKSRAVKVGQRVTLTAIASDDGVPKRRPMPPARLLERVGAGGTPNSASGLRLAWFVYRGDGPVTFDPLQFKVWEDQRPGTSSPWSPGWEPPPIPEGGKWLVGAIFGKAGTYVLRCLAHDGGLTASEDVTFVVNR